MAINKVFLSGNITRDAQLRSTQGGMAILSFGLAVNDRRRQDDGTWVDVPNFFDCNIFGKRAESLAQYLMKGTKVAVEGRLHWSSWEKDGQKHSKVDVNVDEIEFMSSRNGNGGQRAPQQGGYQQRAPQQGQQQAYINQAPMGYQQQAPQPDVAQSDIPF